MIHETPQLRTTRQRAAILDAFRDQPRRLFSVTELIATTSRKVPGMGVATVYRTLKALLEMGKIHAVPMPGAPDRYQFGAKTTSRYIVVQCDGTAFSAEYPTPGNAVTYTFEEATNV